MNTGTMYAAAAYALWGLFPIYIKALAAVPPLEILAHRMAWSLAFVAALLAWRRGWDFLRTLDRRVLVRFAGSAAFVSINWGVYIWAIHRERVIDASLGYFINPLVNVAIAAVFLRERLSALQWSAVALAGAGVAWLTWQAGTVPWVGLVLACSFACYGLLRKTAPLGALQGLALETALLFPFAASYLAWLAWEGRNAFVAGPAALQWLLAAAGPVTAIPLLLFAAGARRISFTALGLLQYIGPSIQLALGIWLYGEPFPPARAVGFALIWAALAVYTASVLPRRWFAMRQT
ncbi:MAG: EamA family transporter RarD [Burkholderiaceae bacterium]|nr:EamA family transporter RarD [Burkholderiaceae bacterium]